MSDHFERTLFPEDFSHFWYEVATVALLSIYHAQLAHILRVATDEKYARGCWQAWSATARLRVCASLANKLLWLGLV